MTRVPKYNNNNDKYDEIKKIRIDLIRSFMNLHKIKQLTKKTLKHLRKKTLCRKNTKKENLWTMY